MPEDIDAISPEELFSQQFKKQLASSEAGDMPENNSDTPIVGDEVQNTPPYVEAPQEPDVADAKNIEDIPEEGEKIDANETVAEEKPEETKEKSEPEEPWDIELFKTEQTDSPEVEWKAAYEVKEELDEIDDGRKDGAEGVNGEMEDEDMEEFQVITEKEFQAQLKEDLLPTLMKFFRPELLNRFDELIFFTPLRMEDLIKIVDVMLRETREMLGEKNLQLKLTDAARAFLAEKGYNPAFGARPLRRAIQEYLEDPLSDLLIQGAFAAGDIIFCDAISGKLEFKKDVGNGKVEDPFAVLDETKKQEEAVSESAEKSNEQDDITENDLEDPFAEKGELANPNNPANQQPNGGISQQQTTEQSPFVDPNRQAQPNEQAGYVFPADQNEANQHPIAAQNDVTEKKRSFLDKMFVKPKADINPVATRESRGDGIRFVDGKIVEE